MIRKRDDGTDVHIEFTVLSYGSLDSWTDPGDPAEVQIDEAIALDTDEVVELSEAERERIEQELAEIMYREGPDDDW